jgi:hypothetical protein
MEHWKAGHPNAAMAIPIMASYRHGIELALKAEIREAARCLRRDGGKDPAIQADQLDRAVPRWACDAAVQHARRLCEPARDSAGLGPAGQMPGPG